VHSVYYTANKQMRTRNSWSVFRCVLYRWIL